jgi:predicted glycoside hydrolase/deacetylase ChbG (UPF0249 family)
MLIVNADDLGRTRAATDNTLRAYVKNRISSTSAMVFMEDSERAAELALAAGIDVGLHINFSERLTARSVPPRLRDDHERIVRFLRANKYALLFYHPLLREQFRWVFEAQHAEFFRLYGRQPSHLDGHHHMHLASNMLIQHILPGGTKVRRSFSFRPGERSLVNRWYRAMVDRRLARRHHLTDYFFSLAQHLAPDRLDPIIALAKRVHVELMTHPHIPVEYEFLLSDEYGRALSQVHLVGYDAL